MFLTAYSNCENFFKLFHNRFQITEKKNIKSSNHFPILTFLRIKIFKIMTSGKFHEDDKYGQVYEKLHFILFRNF